MNTNSINRALQARAEVISSPVEKGVKIKATDIQFHKKYSGGFFFKLFKCKTSPRLLCILCQGTIPHNPKKWCRDVLGYMKAFEIQENWIIYVQEIIKYPSDIGMYVASHASVVSDFLGIRQPNLGSLIYDEFTEFGKNCLIYSVAPK